MDIENIHSSSAPPYDYGVDIEWTDISISDTEPLPKLPKNATFANPKFIARSYHSQVYSVDVTIRKKKKCAILKLFPKGLENRYARETEAYRFLAHYDIADSGYVPVFYGDLPSIGKQMLTKMLQDSIPSDVEVPLPASGILIEYLEGGVTPSKENITVPMAKSILAGLDAIHGARVLHGDTEARNIFIFPETGRIVWFDFSNSTISTLQGLFLMERRPIKFLLFDDFVRSQM
jgi:serine/threonine protein kinase